MNLNFRNQNPHLDISNTKTPLRKALGEIGNQRRDFLANNENIKLSQNVSVHSRPSFNDSKAYPKPEKMGPYIDESDINVIGNFPGYQRINEDPSFWPTYIGQMFATVNPKYIYHPQPNTFPPYETPKDPVISFDDLPLPDFEFKYD